MPVDAPEAEWDNLQIVFATSDGMRRNNLADFTTVKRNGKIAMKLPEGVTLINVRTCNDGDDVMLVTALGRAIRFPTTDLRVFSSRESTGVRGVRLAEGDSVVSMSASGTLTTRRKNARPSSRCAGRKRVWSISGRPAKMTKASRPDRCPWKNLPKCRRMRISS